MKILDYVVCDDIRREIKNKFTLCGSYNDRMEFQILKGTELKLPFFVPSIGFYIRVDLEKEANFTDVQVDFFLNGKQIQTSTNKVLSITSSDKPMILPIVIRGFEVKELGDLQFTVSLFNNGVLVTKSEVSEKFIISKNEVQQQPV